MTKKISSLAAGLCAATAALALSTSVTAGAAEPGRYVAIGDSYASVGDPIQIDVAAGPESTLCARGRDSYPRLIAQWTGMTLTQESCSGATLADYWNPTARGPVPLRPQREAVTPDTDLVTIQLGGNPSALDNVAPSCLPTLVGSSTGCENVAGAVDAGAYSRDYGAIVRDVQSRAPQAKVLLVGYPNIVGDANQTCPEVGFSKVSDRAGVEAYIAKLNSVGRDVAAQTGAVFVEPAADTAGVCGPRGVREASVEGVLIGDSAAPAHLTSRGHFRQAEAVRANLG